MYYPTHAFSPSFPAITRTQSQKIAQEFLNKVLDDGETIEFSERSVGQLNTETHRFSGDILINGLLAVEVCEVDQFSGLGIHVEVVNVFREESGAFPSLVWTNIRLLGPTTL